LELAWQQIIEEIRNDNLSGAVSLTVRGALALTLLADGSQALRGKQFREELSTAGQALIEAQPTMASLFNLVNAVLLSIENLDDLSAMKAMARTTATEFSAALGRRTGEISRQAARLIEEGATVLTHSYSSTVLKALLAAHQDGKSFRVICTESRPMLEGRDLALRLGQAGIEVTLIVDAAAFYFLPRAGLILIGADSLSRPGLVNKIGTYGLALTARAHRVPVYALCGTEKFWPQDCPPIEAQDPKDAREILAEPAENVEALNYYFDLTPLTYLTAIVTERGTLSAAEVEKNLQEIKVYSGLVRIIHGH
jgi:translation initiation factor eIF-2B subunit delta